MNPEKQFCPNPDCIARGPVGQGNIGIHSYPERRYVCHTCHKTFSETKGTAVYGLKRPQDDFVKVTTLLAHGCPPPAAAIAFDLDIRTVYAWLERAGQHCQVVHQTIIGTSKLDLGQVQADEIKVKTQRGTVWMALAQAVPSRLWLGGVISTERDLTLIRALVTLIVTVALCRPLLLAVDGLASYGRAFREAFRAPLPRTTPGRPQLRPWEDIAIVQGVKQRASGALAIDRRIVQGDIGLVQWLVQHTQGGGSINTAFIERLNATFRQRLVWLVRRGRHLARTSATLAWGMSLVGCVYNLCTYHDSLRLPLHLSPRHRRWVQRTPALAAGLTDHRWSVHELLTFNIPLSPSVAPKKRGRPPKVRFEAVA